MTLGQLLLICAELGPDERRVIALIAERLAAGRRIYGELDLEADRRDFAAEASEELIDGAIYLAAGALKAERRKPEPPNTEETDQ
jgi:hypothetical protein